MKLIPAIDLKDNKVVLASGGNRSNYNPLPTYLSPTSDPIMFIDYLISIHNFNTIYLADLDSIEKYSVNSKLINSILERYKNIRFIIDNGVREFSQINRYKSENYIQIIATESYKDYKSLLNKKFNSYILSLDYSEGKVLSINNDYMLINPKKVISMSLNNIGSNHGPNKDNLITTKNIYPLSNIIVSGGVRNNSDIEKLKKEEIKEVILLTAILKKSILYNNL